LFVIEKLPSWCREVCEVCAPPKEIAMAEESASTTKRCLPAVPAIDRRTWSERRDRSLQLRSWLDDGAPEVLEHAPPQEAVDPSAKHDALQERLERAAIMEFDGGLPREAAEREAERQTLGESIHENNQSADKPLKRPD